jgi:hypothetical protein
MPTMTATEMAAAPINLFRAGWKAEEVFGDEVNAHHMGTSSVYTFKANPNISIKHYAVYADQVPANCQFDRLDRFVVMHTHSHEYHESGALFTSITSHVATYDAWLGAYYKALEVIKQEKV